MKRECPSRARHVHVTCTSRGVAAAMSRGISYVPCLGTEPASYEMQNDAINNYALISSISWRRKIFFINSVSGLIAR